MPIEMIAPVVALSSFSDRVVGADIILLIDSEAVEAALVKGYSSREDMCHIISVFWDLALEMRCRILLTEFPRTPIQLIGRLVRDLT